MFPVLTMILADIFSGISQETKVDKLYFLSINTT